MPKQPSENEESGQSIPLTQPPEFQAAQVRQLHAQSRMGIYWALVSVIIVALALREQIPHLKLGIWVFVYLIVQAYRYHLMINFSKCLYPESIVSWGQKFSFSTVASGLTWGLAPIVIFPADSAVHQMFLTIALSGIAAAAASVYSPLTICYLPTVLAILVPLSARFFYQGQEVDVFIGICMLILAAALVMTGKQMNAAVTESLKLRFENKDLLDSVTGQKRIAENLLREIHHRVKNNLQVICSLLRLQARHLKSEETRMIFKDTETRVKSMAMLHEALYQSEDLERIPVKNYMNDLAAQIIESYSSSRKGINLNISVEDIGMTIDTAIPCGLIVNELVTNALKHAFPDSSKGEINILLHSAGENELELVVRDNGQGMPKGVAAKGLESLGLNLVRTFVNQLRGEMKLNGLKGTEFRIRFKNEAARTRR
jgi:two-component sensor histidine kinase